MPPSKEIERFENLPKPPVNVAPAKFPKQALASRSLLSLLFRHIQPNWRSYIQYVDLAARKGDPHMMRYRDVYLGLPKHERNHAWPEQICDLAGVDPSELVGAVSREMWATKAAESSLISSMAHPELLMHTIRLAKRPENQRDRELCFRMMGSLPDKKGTSINIFNAPLAQANTEIPEIVGKSKLRSFDEEVIEMSRDLEVGEVFAEEERRRPTPDVPFLVKDVPPESH